MVKQDNDNLMNTTVDFEQLLFSARPEFTAPRAEFKEQLRRDLKQMYAKRFVENKKTVHEVFEEKTVAPSPLSSIWQRIKESFSLRIPRMSFAPVMLLLLFSITSVYAYTSPQVTRKHSLYVIKKTIENLELSLNNNSEKKISTYLRLSERRLEEARYLASYGELDSETIIELNEDINNSLQALQEIEDEAKKSAFIGDIAETSQNNLEGLQEIASEVIENNADYAEIAYLDGQQAPEDIKIPEEITSLARVINNVSTNTKEEKIEQKIALAGDTQQSILNDIVLNSIPAEIIGYSGSANIFVTAFDQNGKDITDSGLLFNWKVIDGGGALQQIGSHQAHYVKNDEGQINDSAIVEVTVSQNERVLSTTYNISFINPLADVSLSTNFGDTFDINSNIAPTLKAMAITNDKEEYVSENINFFWEVVDGDLFISKPNSATTTINPKTTGWVTVKVTASYGNKSFSKQISFNIIKKAQESTPEVIQTEEMTPVHSSTPVKTKTIVPSKELYLKITTSDQSITVGQTVNLKFTVVDGNWDLYPNEVVKASLSGLGTLSSVTNNRDGSYSAVYTAPAKIASSSVEVIISGVVTSVASKPEVSTNVTIFDKTINIGPRSLSAAPGDIIDLPLNISVPEFISLRSYSFYVRLPNNLQLVSGGSPTAKGVYLEGVEPGTRILRLKVQENIPSQKISISITGVEAIDSSGDQLRVNKGSGYITIKSDIEPSPTIEVKEPTKVYTVVPTKIPTEIPVITETP